MTSKERMLTAILNKKPDRVPCAPDMSEMIPCKRTGKPFWKVSLNNNPPRWKAYVEALDYFKFDGWFLYGSVTPRYKSKIKWEDNVIEKNQDSVELEQIVYTPAGTLKSVRSFPKDNPSWLKERFVKDIQKDIEKLKYLLPVYYTEYEGFDDSEFREMKKIVGDKAVVTIGIPTPGFHVWEGWFEGGIEALTYALYDFPELLNEFRQIHHKDMIRYTEMVIEAKPDFILTAGSGAITMSSPSLYRKFGLPTLIEISRMAKSAGIPTMIHCCGKEKDLVKMCYDETDINCVNPLEEPPMGDCCLKEIKEKYGSKLSFMGNINTTLMVFGKPEEIEEVSKKAIDDAGQGGGFILSTGDQCGRDTPEENIFRMIEVAKTYGKY